MLLITGSMDQTVKLKDLQTINQLYSFNFDSSARAVDFSIGDKLAIITTDPFKNSLCHLRKTHCKDSVSFGSCSLVGHCFLCPIDPWKKSPLITKRRRVWNARVYLPFDCRIKNLFCCFCLNRICFVRVWNHKYIVRFKSENN